MPDRWVAPVERPPPKDWATFDGSTVNNASEGLLLVLVAILCCALLAGAVLLYLKEKKQQQQAPDGPEQDVPRPLVPVLGGQRRWRKKEGPLSRNKEGGATFVEVPRVSVAIA